MVIKLMNLKLEIPVTEIEFKEAAPSTLNHLHMPTGEGMGELSLADRATIANMSPEHGAIMGFFPVDHVTLQYLKLTGRSDETVRFSFSFSFFFFFLNL